jgi:hypothetical protein
MQKPHMMPPPVHYKVKKPVVVAPPVVVPAPAAPVVPKKKSFKERWESKFFRDRVHFTLHGRGLVAVAILDCL